MSVLLLSFPTIYYLLIGATRHYFARYALPLVPFIVFFAAETIVALWAWAAEKRKLGWVLATVLIVAAVAQPLVQSIRHDVLLTRPDTRTLAKQWIEETIPEGSRIAVDWPVHTPPLSTPEWPKPDSARVYEVTAVGGAGLSDHPLAWYREEGFDYLIASSFVYDIPLVYEQWDIERRVFYAALDKQLELVREFRPGAGQEEPPFIFDEIYGPAISLWQRSRPGPVIKVYRVR